MGPRPFNLLLSLVAGVVATQEGNLSRAPSDAPRLARAKDSAFSSRDASPPPPKPRGSLPITQAVWDNSIRPRKSPTGSNPASVDPHRTGAWETPEMSEGRFPHKAEGAPQLALAHEAASSSPSKRELEALEREAADLDAFKRKLTSAQVQDHTSGWCGTIEETNESEEAHRGRHLTAEHCTSSFNDPKDEYDAYAPGKGLYRITVVIHSIAEEGCTQYSCGYIPTACLTSGISLLNTHFRGQNSFAEEIGADTGIEYVLATTDPSGSPTDGIVRHYNTAWFNYNRWSGQAAGFWSTAWDQSRYMNIYLHNTGTTCETCSSTLLGYANFPYNTPATTDGFVELWSRWGANDGSCPSNNLGHDVSDDLGTTATHEIGHYLGLKHTFTPNDGINSPFEDSGETDVGQCPPQRRPYCSFTGDLICDTNSEKDVHYQCTSRESCGLKDPIRNFMSYTSGTCMDMFTAEQARRMRCCLESYRSSLFSTSSMPPAPPPSTSYVPQPASVSATTCICASTWTWGSSGSCGVTQNGCTTDTACQDWWFSPSPPPPGLSWCKVRYT